MLLQPNVVRWMLLLAGIVMWSQVGCDSQFVNYQAAADDDMVPLNDMSPPDLKQMKKTRHQAVHFCRQCHVSGSSLRSQRFTKPVPRLCYDCHEDHTTANPYVHGPVAVGACLFCHRPHVSTFEHLLRVSQPRLCMRCHETQTAPLSPVHQDTSDQLCTQCHDPHGGTHPLFLTKEARVGMER
jgi:predicted CXXCH cytochrome family protein